MFLKYFHPLCHHHRAAFLFIERVQMIKYLIHSLTIPYNLLQATYNSPQDKATDLVNLTQSL